MERKSISAFLGGLVDLLDISKSEPRKFYFQADSELTGTYELKLWNSDKKNTSYEVPNNAIVRDENLLTLTFDATTWTLEAGQYYYEIIKVEDKQIYFKGTAIVIN